MVLNIVHASLTLLITVSVFAASNTAINATIIRKKTTRAIFGVHIPLSRELLVKPDGTLLREGDFVRNLKLGRTLRLIAENPQSFYDGPLAQEIVDDIAEYGGNITRTDLTNYAAVVKPPLKVTLRNGGYTLYNPPPPSSGAVIDFIMSVLDGFNFSSDNLSSADQTVLTYHIIAEAFKFAYARRAELGDESFVNVTELTANMTSADYAANIGRKIRIDRTQKVAWYQPAHYSTTNGGTSHLNVLAPDGTAVSLTSTINLRFGSKVRGNRTGIIFNDQMDDFSSPKLTNYFGLPPSPSNFIAPGKMPMSSTCPTIVLNRQGKVAFLGGASGGSRITSATAFVMINSLWFNEDLKTASDKGRIHHQLFPPELFYEPWLHKDVLNGLQSKNHNTTVSKINAVVNSIRNNCAHGDSTASFDWSRARQTCIEAVSDGRKGGIPDGF